METFERMRKTGRLDRAVLAQFGVALPGAPSIAEELESTALRDEYRQAGIEIGMYSYGCFNRGRVHCEDTHHVWGR